MKTMLTKGLTTAILIASSLFFAKGNLFGQCPTSNGASITCGQTATLTASGGSSYNWYSSSSGGTPLGTGPSFTTPVINSNTSYYVGSPGQPSQTSGFSGCYSSQNWSLIQQGGGNGSVNSGGMPGSMTLTGPNNTSGGAYTFYSVTVPVAGTISFNWSVSHNDPFYDSFGYSINGNNTTITSSSGSGFISISVPAGATFRFYGYTNDGCCGTFTATVSNFSGPCVSECIVPSPITVNPVPAPSISFVSDTVLCAGDSVELQINQQGNVTWNTGATTPTIFVNQGGSYTASYVTPAGCNSNISQPFSISAAPVPTAPSISALTSTSVCGNDTVILQTNQSQGVEWSNQDTGQTVTITVQGNYFATYTNPQGCSSLPSNAITVTVNPAPNIQLASNFNLCEGSPAVFNPNVQLGNTNNPSISQVLWTYGDGNQSNVLQQPHTYGQAGIYNAQLVVQTNHGCSDSAQTSVSVNPKPIINSTGTSPVCQGQSMSFSQNSQVTNTNNASIQTYAWNFGDNNQGTGSATSHTYAQEGSYQGHLIITTNHGCRDTAFMNLLVHPNPVIQSPTISSGCQGAATAFGAQVSISNVNNASIITETWNTGDGNTANGANTTHTYAQPGTYNAQLIVSSNHGCVDSAQVSAIVNPTPQLVQSSFPDVCLGQLSQFSQSTSLANVNNAQITGFAWDFGNGNQSNSLNPTQLYAQTGSYIVQLTVQTNQNCPMVVTDTVLVNPYPVIASINANSVCLGNLSNFTQSSSVPNTNGSTISQYLWSFGNGNSSTNASPSYTYPNAGSYNAQLMVTTNFGCTDTLQTNVLVNPNPVLSNLSLSDVCMGNPTSLNAGVSIPNINGASLASQNWDMGDGTQLSGSNLSHNYQNPGLFVVQGTISSNQGCALQVTDTALVFPNPNASLASANTVCEETATSFNGNASISAVNGAAIAAYQWNFGDGNAANAQNPSHNYATWGNYNYHMVVSSNHGCLDTLFGNATVHPKPVAQFDLPGHCGGSPMPLTDFSSIPAGSIDSYLWTSSDGLNSGQQNPVWTLAQGQQQVTLLLTSDQGCTDTLSKSIAVGQPFNTSFAPTLVGTATVQFLPDTLDPYLNYMWDFGDGTVSYQINPQHTYWNSGIYTVCLTISDSLCSSSYCTDMQLNATGVETLEAQLLEIKVGPNPFKDQLLIQLPEYNGNWSVFLRDAQGRLIGQKTSTQNQLLWNGLEHLSSGIYLVQVETGEGTRFVKVLK